MNELLVTMFLVNATGDLLALQIDKHTVYPNMYPNMCACSMAGQKMHSDIA